MTLNVSAYGFPGAPYDDMVDNISVLLVTADGTAEGEISRQAYNTVFSPPNPAALVSACTIVLRLQRVWISMESFENFSSLPTVLGR